MTVAALRTPITVCRVLVAPLWLLAVAAHGQLDVAPPLVERVHHLENQAASEAVERVCPLLSARGSVEVQDGGRTLVVRDIEPIVERVMELLADHDRGGRRLKVTVQIVSAEVGGSGPATAATLELPSDVVERLQSLLRYRSYSLLARADLEAREEVESSFEVGTEFRVSFRLDRAAGPERVRMREFRVLSRTDGGDLRPLVHTHLSLEMGRPMILGLAPTEASDRALMVVLRAETVGVGEEAHG